MPNCRKCVHYSERRESCTKDLPISVDLINDECSDYEFSHCVGCIYGEDSEECNFCRFNGRNAEGSEEE